MNVAGDAGEQAARTIIDRLCGGGHVALLAGGCVRDMLLKRTPKDHDVATDALPQRVGELFARTRQVGAKFGVVIVRVSGQDVEVATFRTDGAYLDGRHPEDVTFGTAEQDALRRDFTINGLFYDPNGDRVIDHVGGRADLDAGVLRTIGDPDRRFGEDHLRLLRAVRLAARLGFVIDPATQKAIKRLAPNLTHISAERIWMELDEMICAPTRADAWSMLVGLELQAYLSDQWALDDGFAARIQCRIAALPDRPVDSALALAVLRCDRSTNDATSLARALRLSNRVAGELVWLIRSLPAMTNAGACELADLKLLMANSAWGSLLELFRADLIARKLPLAGFDEVVSRAEGIPGDRIAPPPLFSGNDLAEMGMQPGPRVGSILEAVYRSQLNEEITNEQQAKALAAELIRA